MGGIGVFFEDGSPYNIGEKMTFKDDGKVSNNVCELTACLRAILSIKDFKNFDRLNDSILIYTDSKYVINCITLWYDNWAKNNWKTSNGLDVKNLDLIKKLYNLVKSKDVSFFNIIEFKFVSVLPPLFDMIVAHPLEPASIEVLPKGSSHVDGLTAIFDFS